MARSTIRVHDPHQYVDSVLRGIRRRTSFNDLVGDVLALLGVLLVVLLVEIYVDQVALLSRNVRVLWFRILQILLVGGVLWISVFYLRKRLSEFYVVGKIEQLYPEFKESLSTYLHARKGTIDLPPPRSDDPMMRCVLGGLTLIDPDKIAIRLSRVVRPLCAFGTVLFVTLAFGIFGAVDSGRGGIARSSATPCGARSSQSG